MKSNNGKMVSKSRNFTSDIGDYDYIIKTIQYLEYHFRIHFFITTRDFDILYNWWEKRIPLQIINESISNVVKRWQARGKNITGFSNFSYEVRKNFRSFMELSIGSEKKVEKEKYFEIKKFFQYYPPELMGMKKDFERVFLKIKKEQDISLDKINKKLLDLFKNDDELNLKTRVFMKSLAKQLRGPEVEQRYRLNYLRHKFAVPDFEVM